MNTETEVKLLGPLEVAVEGRHVEFEGAKQRRLFVALALRAPEPVPVDALVETVWGDQAAAGRGLRAGDRAHGARHPPLRGADEPRRVRPGARAVARTGTRRPPVRQLRAGRGRAARGAAP